MSNPDSDHQAHSRQSITSNAATQTRITRSAAKILTDTEYQPSIKELEDTIKLATQTIPKLEKERKSYDRKRDYLTLLKTNELTLQLTFWARAHNTALEKLQNNPQSPITKHSEVAVAHCEVQSLTNQNKDLTNRLKESHEKLIAAEHKANYSDSLAKTIKAEASELTKQIQHLSQKLKEEAQHKQRLEQIDQENAQQRTKLESDLNTANNQNNLLQQKLKSLELTINQNTSSYTANKNAYEKQVQNLKNHISTLITELTTAEETSISYSETLLEKQRELADKDFEINQLRQANIDQQDFINNLQPQITNSPQRQQQNINLLDDITMANVAEAIQQSLQELISHQNKQQIPLYSGFLNDLPIEDWIKDAERVARTAGWDNTLKFKFFSDRLRGIAATFNDEYLETNQNTTYADWKQALVTRFTIDNESEGHKKELEELQQGPNQRVSDFKSFIDQKFIKAYGKNAAQSGDTEMTKIREDIKKKVLMRGLKPKILELLWQRIKPNDSFDKIVEEAIEIETILHKKESIAKSDKY